MVVKKQILFIKNRRSADKQLEKIVSMLGKNVQVDILKFNYLLRDETLLWSVSGKKEVKEYDAVIMSRETAQFLQGLARTAYALL